jgi:hypothetical protein
MVSEMNAGWYRYIMEWRFAPDGTIRPRYGFGSTKNACVCSAHQHNAYWRFDFDIVNPTNKIFQIERGRKFLKPITREANVLRNYATNRGFVIQNSTATKPTRLRRAVLTATPIRSESAISGCLNIKGQPPNRWKSTTKIQGQLPISRRGSTTNRLSIRTLLFGIRRTTFITTARNFSRRIEADKF